MILRAGAGIFPALMVHALSMGSGLAAAVPGASGPATATPLPDIRRDATVEAIERVMPSVVNIGTVTLVERHDEMSDLLRQFFGYSYRRQRPEAAYSLGSGVIIDESGYALTNEHVVEQATRIRVKLMDGREFDAERVAGIGGSDVALLKLVTKGSERFTAVKFARDDDLLLGETVLALGNPFGLGGSVSRGILSSKNRRPPRENEPLDVADWLQTDAAINFGNSGGPLVNVRGELIGLNVAVSREGQGIGFAIPIKRVNEALSTIFTPEGIKSLWFGARVRTGTNGVVVTPVEESSPAAKAGVLPNDIVVQVNNKPVYDLIGFNRELLTQNEHRDVPLLIARQGSRKAVNLRLVPETSFFNAELIRRRTGATLQALTPQTAERVGLSPEAGFWISAVDANSPAATAGLERGFVVLGLGGQPAENLTAMAKALHPKKRGDKIVLNILIQRRLGNLIRRETEEVELSLL
jgi:serine protease Do